MLNVLSDAFVACWTLMYLPANASLAIDTVHKTPRPKWENGYCRFFAFSYSPAFPDGYGCTILVYAAKS